MIDGRDEVTDKVLDRLGNPNNLSPWSRQGRGVGHVKSGEAANYTGLICKAADARGPPPFIPRRKRLLPLIEGVAHFLGAFPRGGDAPLRPAPDGHPPLLTGMPGVDSDGSRA